MTLPFFNRILKRPWRRTSTESETAQFGRDARADWRFVFLAFFALNALSVGFGVFLYERINKGEFFLVDKKQPVTAQALDRFALEQTVAFFKEKQARFDTLKRGPLTTRNPFDPSVTPKK